MMTWLHTESAEMLGWTLVHSVWELALIGAATATGLGMLRRASPQVRYVVGLMGMVLMVASPVVTFGVIQARGGEGRAEVLPYVAVVSAVESGADVAPVAPVQTAATVRGAVAPAGVLVRVAVVVRPWLPSAVGINFCCCIVLCLRLGAGLVRLRQMRKGALAVSPALEALAKRLSRRLGLSRGVRILQGTAVEVPTVIGAWRPVILLPLSTLTGP